ncbi:secretin N-terminal domain-containing protein [Pseudoalteromonas ulvae]|uniref:Type II secretory pathway component PulD-like protein n=1 Tax=Pseudoalteromonas ulvae TaxID=107327 RepID=A0A244CQL6_PSEDV|nr:secretin N-terminal domain-containing protein [Pseudoalteromonas ulvae]OUL57911.1 Type II secretory pathway component PulD-like protein [Pseudoalteromonas ulvae]
MKQLNPILLTLLSVGLLTACNSSPNKFTAQKSYLNNNTTVVSANGQADEAQLLTQSNQVSESAKKAGELQVLPALRANTLVTGQNIELATQFSRSELVSLTADALPITDYLHYVLGEVLKVSYIVADDVTASNQTITLNLQEKISKQKLFALSEQLLQERGITVRLADDVYYIHQSEGGAAGQIVYGYGNRYDDVPNTSNDIIQLAPFNNGMQTSLANTIKQLTGVDVRPIFEQQALMIRGKRSAILKALEFMQLMDQPVFKNRSIGLYEATYISVEDLSKQLLELLKQEGVTASIQASSEQAVSMVPIDRTNSLVFFTNNGKLLERVNFWAKQLDKPADGNQQQYFMFVPQFARAIDLGQSLQALLGQGAGLSNSTSAEQQNSANNSPASQTKTQASNVSVNSNDLKMVVDERSNSLIFYTSGARYRDLLPLIKRLDLMPKQVVLEVMIAEVSLTDVFQQGVEFALTNQGASKVGGYKLGVDKTGLSYILTGTLGNINLNLLETNSNVNVLSRPSLAVRDGVKASITVGDKIPTVGEIVTDPVNGSRTSVVYLNTGIELQVTPTVNARGAVLMEIAQKISNQASGGSSLEGNPTLFERSISTEVIAGNGQTIMLGGLISERSTENDRSVPFFSSIPILGNLFDGTDNNSSKTELVVLVTPRIIESTNEWQAVFGQFQQTLSDLQIEK